MVDIDGGGNKYTTYNTYTCLLCYFSVKGTYEDLYKYTDTAKAQDIY